MYILWHHVDPPLTWDNWAEAHFPGNPPTGTIVALHSKRWTSKGHVPGEVVLLIGDVNRDGEDEGGGCLFDDDATVYAWSDSLVMTVAEVDPPVLFEGVDDVKES